MFLGFSLHSSLFSACCGCDCLIGQVVENGGMILPQPVQGVWDLQGFFVCIASGFLYHMRKMRVGQHGDVFLCWGWDVVVVVM